MAWTDEQWAMFTSVLTRAFAARDPFTADDAQVYRLLLDAVEPDAAMEALRAIVLEGKALRPKPGEIVERCRRDPGIPTFEEAYRLIFGPGGILAARPPVGPMTYKSEADRRAIVDRAAAERAATMHPLVGSFVARQGLDRLRALPVADPDYGELRRKELRAEWDRHIEASDGREVATLAAGDGHKRLHQFDPLAVLGIDRGQAALEAGKS